MMAKQTTLAILHRPWSNADKILKASTGWSASDTLDIISAVLTNTYPSRSLVSSLLSPIIPPLYSLIAQLSSQRVGNPALLDSSKSLFVTWAKIVDLEEAREILWCVVDGQGGVWTVEDGELLWQNR